MEIWVDDIRVPPIGMLHAYSVNTAKRFIEICEKAGEPITCIYMDHDLGDYATDGGDAIKLLDWLVERKTFYPISIHTMNPVGRKNMQRMIDRYWP